MMNTITVKETHLAIIQSDGDTYTNAAERITKSGCDIVIKVDDLGDVLKLVLNFFKKRMLEFRR